MSGRIVYDSASVQPGRCPTCGKRLDRCTCGKAPAPRAAPSVKARVPKDGVVRLMRDRKGRGGKVVTLITGLAGDLEGLARELKKLCGTGGTVRGDVIEIQGDHRDRLADDLRQRGYTVKLAGG